MPPAIRKIGVVLSASLIFNTTSHAEKIVPNEDVEKLAMQYRASNFLQSATMGFRQRDVDRLADAMMDDGIENAIEAWLDDQLDTNIGRTFQRGVTIFARENPSIIGSVRDTINYWHFSWMSNAILSNDQLRQRVTFGLYQIYPTTIGFFAGQTNFGVNQAPAAMMDVLYTNAFSNHDSILQGVSRNALMGVTLTHAHNRKENPNNGTLPDENYAREVMQLFSIGVFSRSLDGNVLIDEEGNPVENYTNEDILEMAKVFTGLVTLNGPNGVVNGPGNPNLARGQYFTRPMRGWEPYHDKTRKKILGHSIKRNQDTLEDVRDAIDILVEHPSTAPHMTIRLLQRLTASNPSPGYVERVASVWQQSRGNMPRILRAIYLDPEFIGNLEESVVVTNVNEGESLVSYTSANPLSGKVREQPLKWTAFYRLFEAESASPSYAKGLLAATRLSIGRVPGGSAFLPGWAADVFGHYEWDYSENEGPMGDYIERTGEFIVSPEMQIVNRSAVNSFRVMNSHARDYRADKNERFSRGVDIPKLEELATTLSYSDFLDFLDTYMCHGKLSLEYKQLLIDQYGGLSRANRVGYTLASIFDTAEYSITY